MNHQQPREAKHDDDPALSEFLASLMDYTPTIPDELVEHYVAKSGFQCPDVRLIRLVAVATQKFIAEVASDALQQCKARHSAPVKEKRDKQQKEKRLILTMEDLSKALRESCFCANPKELVKNFRSKERNFRNLRSVYAFLVRLGVKQTCSLGAKPWKFLYGVNMKHQEYFADSPSTGMDPAARDE